MAASGIPHRDRSFKWHEIRFDKNSTEISWRKEIKMRKLVCAFAAGILAVALAVPVFAQTNANHANRQAMQPESTDSSSKAIITGGGASEQDLNSARYKAWDEFQGSHPQVARELMHNHRLAGSSSFVQKHPDLKQLFESNAGMQQDMMQHPGNYMARMSAGHHHHHHRNATSA